LILGFIYYQASSEWLHGHPFPVDPDKDWKPELQMFSVVLSSPVQLLLIIGAGSFFGGVARYLLSQFIQDRFLSAFPFGTLTVNVIGCFLVGLVFGLSEKTSLPGEWRMFLTTGFVGGFTTFSAFSLETMSLFRDAQYVHAALYVGVSVLLGLSATYLGLTLLKLA
jgi:CrcB protein